MFEFAQLLTSSPWPIVGAGGLMGGVMFDWQARGEGFWMRNPGVGLISVAMGGVMAYFIALYSADLGLMLVIKGATGGAAGVWLVLGMITLWRNNILIGAVLDRKYVAFVISVILAGGFIYGMVYQVHTPLVRWTWFALPILAGALYRLWLVLDFARQPGGAQQQIGQEIDKKLSGGTMEAAKKQLFDPFQTRQAATEPQTQEDQKEQSEQEQDIQETAKNFLQKIGEVLQKDL